jgi:hypothetical protein
MQVVRIHQRPINVQYHDLRHVTDLLVGFIYMP